MPVSDVDVCVVVVLVSVAVVVVRDVDDSVVVVLD